MSTELAHPHRRPPRRLFSLFLASSPPAYRAINKSPSRANPANPLTDAPVLSSSFSVPHRPARVHDPLRSRDELRSTTSILRKDAGCWKIARYIARPLDDSILALSAARSFAWASTGVFMSTRIGSELLANLFESKYV